VRPSTTDGILKDIKQKFLNCYKKVLTLLKRKCDFCHYAQPALYAIHTARAVFILWGQGFNPHVKWLPSLPLMNSRKQLTEYRLYLTVACYGSKLTEINVAV